MVGEGHGRRRRNFDECDLCAPIGRHIVEWMVSVEGFLGRPFLFPVGKSSCSFLFPAVKVLPDFLFPEGVNSHTNPHPWIGLQFFMALLHFCYAKLQFLDGNFIVLYCSFFVLRRSFLIFLHNVAPETKTGGPHWFCQHFATRYGGAMSRVNLRSPSGGKPYTIG